MFLAVGSIASMPSTVIFRETLAERKAPIFVTF